MGKTICIYHSIDLDGWMSAAIVKKYYMDKNINNTDTNKQYNFKENGEYTGIPILNSHNEINFVGWNYGSEIPDLTDYDDIIMCDISFPKEVMKQIAIDYTFKSFSWCDHHISAINDSIDGKYDGISGLRDTKKAACELTWEYFYPNQVMPEIVRLLGRYDCFGHKGTEEETKVLEFQYGARQCINSYETAYNWLVSSIEYDPRLSNILKNNPVETIHQQGQAIYKYLCTEAQWIYRMGKEIEFTIQGHVKDNPTIWRKYKFFAINRSRFNPVNFGIDYHADGYDGVMSWNFNKDKFTASLYNDNGEVDCSIIAKSLGGGGHRGAAGFVMEDIEKFKLILNLS